MSGSRYGRNDAKAVKRITEKAKWDEFFPLTLSVEYKTDLRCYLFVKVFFSE